MTIEVPAETTRILITDITIVDDSVNEKEEVLVLVAKILGQAANVACFQPFENSTCKSEGHIGGTLLRIHDDDGKYFLCLQMELGFLLFVSFILSESQKMSIH